jgi:hypothetical protein
LLLAIADDGFDADPQAGTSIEDWEESPVRDIDESVGYQRLAWYAAPFGSAAITLLVLAIILNGLKRVGRAIIRLLIR